MTAEHYIFNTEQAAIDAEAYICDKAGYPWVGNRNGVPDPTAQQTTGWAVPWQRVNDNKWVVPVVPMAKMLEIFTAGEATAIVTEFNALHPHTLEFSDASWYPSEE